MDARVQGARPFSILKVSCVAVLAAGLVTLGVWGASASGEPPAKTAATLEATNSPVPPTAALIEVAPPVGEASAAMMDRDIAQAIALSLRPGVLKAVVANKEVASMPFVSSSPADALQRLGKIAWVTQVQGTNLMAVWVKGATQKESADLANALADAIVTQSRHDSMKQSLESISQIDEETGNLSRRLEQMRREDASLLSDATVTNLNIRHKLLEAQQLALAPDLTQLAIAQSAADESLRAFQKQMEKPRQLEGSLEVQQALEADQTLRTLDMMELNLSLEQSEAAARLGPKQESASKAATKLDIVRQKIAERRNELVGPIIKAMLAQREEKLNDLTARLVKAREYYQSSETVSRDLQTRQIKHEQLQKNIDAIQEQVSRLEARKTELVLQSSRRSLRLVSPASAE